MWNKNLKAFLALVLLAVVALSGSCTSSDDGGSPTGGRTIMGAWSGTVTFGYADGTAETGTMTLSIDQTGSFIAGTETFPSDENSTSVTGSLDGSVLTMKLVVRCASGNGGIILELNVVEDTMTIMSATGFVCPEDSDLGVQTASGSLKRTSDKKPL